MRNTHFIQSQKRDRLASHLIDLAGYITTPLNHRGFYNLIEGLSIKLISNHSRCQIKLRDDSIFEFVLADPYWNRLLHSGFRYEPELEYTLELMKGLTYGFIDGGANWGYWSILASSTSFGAAKTVAFEPIPRTFEILKRNQVLNNARFDIRQYAIDAQEAASVPIFFHSESPVSLVGASLLEPAQKDGLESMSVKCVTLDQIIQEFDKALPLIVKLDLEGKEGPVMRASQLINNRDVLILYEDHAKDTTCAASHFVLESGWSVFFVNDYKQVFRVSSLEHVKHHKTRKSRGYNFLAVREGGAFFERLHSKT